MNQVTLGALAYPPTNHRARVRSHNISGYIVFDKPTLEGGTVPNAGFVQSDDWMRRA